MSSPRPLRIVIPGGSGHIGQILARHFFEQGHEVAVIARHQKPSEWPVFSWNGTDLGPWVKCFENADVVINLAGRSVNCRYTPANQTEIRESRILTTTLVGKAITQTAIPPRLWLNASTATIYRHALDRPMDEQTGEIGGHEAGIPPKWRFSVDVATAWERAFFSAETPNTRKVALRSAMVMSPERDGVFDTLLRLVRWGLGGTAGSGRQFVSWIHDVDFLRALEFLIAHEEFEGVVNVASPCPLPNREFMCCLRRAWCTSYIGLPASGWMLELGAIVLRTETELILKSRRVVPARLTGAGFTFDFPNWRGACADLVQRWRELEQSAET